MFLTYHQKLNISLYETTKLSFFTLLIIIWIRVFSYSMWYHKKILQNSIHPHNWFCTLSPCIRDIDLSLVLPAAFCINKAILNTPYFLDTLHPIFLFKYTLHNHHKIVTHVNTYLVWSVQIDIISGLLYIICLSILLRT